MRLDRRWPVSSWFRSPPPRRPGAVTVAVLVCLVVAAMIGGALLRTGFVQRRRIQMEERRLQALWLAESGLERAAARLADAPDYRGETWEVPAADLGGPWAGTVTIAVETTNAPPSRRTVRVQADYPNGAEPRARHHTQAVLDPGPRAPEDRR
jgi:Tfp pilus assembly protein PilX